MVSPAESTHRLYACGVRHFMRTCAVAGRAPVPADEDALCHFAATPAEEGLRHKTIKSYMAGVSHLHISEGHGDLFRAVYTGCTTFYGVSSVLRAWLGMGRCASGQSCLSIKT